MNIEQYNKESQFFIENEVEPPLCYICGQAAMGFIDPYYPYHTERNRRIEHEDYDNDLNESTY